jgi:hypothetical protein
MKFATHLRLLLSLKMSGAIPLLRLYAFTVKTDKPLRFYLRPFI